MATVDSQAFLAALTKLSREMRLCVDLDVGGALTLSPLDPEDKRHWWFYWDKERAEYRPSPEEGLDEP